MFIVNDKFQPFFFLVNYETFLWVNLSKYHSTSVGAYNNFSVRARVSYEVFQVLFLFLTQYIYTKTLYTHGCIKKSQCFLR